MKAYLFVEFTMVMEFATLGFQLRMEKLMFSFVNVYRRAAEIFIHFQHMQTKMKMKNDKYIKVVSALLVIMLYEIHHRIDALTLEPNNFNIFDVFSVSNAHGICSDRFLIIH